MVDGIIKYPMHHAEQPTFVKCMLLCAN